MLSRVLSVIVGLVTLAVGSSLVPLIAFAAYRDAARGQWPPRRVGTDVVSRGQYREGVVPRFSAEGPPATVLAAAIGSWALGQMFVPGLALGLFGALFVVGAVSIPGLILAWQLFRLGRPLLLGEPESAEKARSLARFATILNAVVLAAVAILSGYTLGGSSPTSFVNKLWDVFALGGPVVLYALISLAHAALLRRAAAEVDALHHSKAEAASSGVRVSASEVPSQIDAPIDTWGAVEGAVERSRRG